MTVTAYRELEYRGLLIGPDGPVYVRSVEGLGDLPEMRTGDRPLLLRHGLHAGTDLLGGRTVTLELEVTAYDEATFTTGVEAVLDAFTVGDEAPFTFRVPGLVGGEVGLMMARCRKRAVAMDDEYLGWAAAFTVELVATDPRLYSSLEQVQSTTLPVPGVGRTYNLTFPRVYGAAGSGGTILATNAGNVAAPWVARLDGPLTYPRLENVTLDATVELGLVVQAGEYVIIDSDRRTVLLGGTASRYSDLTPETEWWDLAPGVNEVHFRTVETTNTGTLQLAWRSAWA